MRKPTWGRWREWDVCMGVLFSDSNPQFFQDKFIISPRTCEKIWAFYTNILHGLVKNEKLWIILSALKRRREDVSKKKAKKGRVDGGGRKAFPARGSQGVRRGQSRHQQAESHHSCQGFLKIPHKILSFHWPYTHYFRHLSEKGKAPHRRRRYTFSFLYNKKQQHISIIYIE